MGLFWPIILTSFILLDSVDDHIRCYSSVPAMLSMLPIDEVLSFFFFLLSLWFDALLFNTLCW